LSFCCTSRTQPPTLPRRRTRQNRYGRYESINEALRGSFYRDPAVEACIGAYEKRVLEDKISSFIAAKELLEIYFKDARTLE